MKALMYLGPESLELQEVPAPQGDFIIKVEACGVCGTDLKTYLKGHHFFKPPTVLGHEFTGTVIKVPAGSSCKTGDLVAVAPYLECGSCRHCALGVGQLCQNKHFISGGAFCEFVSIPAGYEQAGGVRVISHGLDRVDAAIAYTLVEPLACVLNGTEHLAATAQSRVLIVGSGPMGTLFALFYKQAGIDVTVLDPNEIRCDIVAPWGISCLPPGAVDIGKFNKVVLAVNKAELVAEYVAKVADGGTVLLFSGLRKEEMLTIDSYSIHYREITLTGSYGYTARHFDAAFGMIEKDPSHYARLITNRFSLETGKEAFELSRAGTALKTVILP
jgi:L-iditol 2-dehydrogenase